MITLQNTVDLMTSADYKDRFKAEYWQLKIRYEKLKAFNTKIEAAMLSKREHYNDNSVDIKDMPKHDCPADLLCEQQNIMRNYLHTLEVRAVFENIDLTEVPHETQK